MKRNRKSSSEPELSLSVQSVREARPKAGKRNVKQVRVDTDESVMATESEIPTESSGLLLSFKEQTNRHLEGISTTMSEMQFQMQEQMKIIVDDVTGMKMSLEGAWVEIEALKSASDQQNATIARLEKSVKSLQAELESEKQKRLHLDFYSRRENLRLVGIEEEEGEKPEDVVREILQQMGVLWETSNFTLFIGSEKNAGCPKMASNITDK